MKRQRISALFLAFSLLLGVGAGGPFAQKADAASLDLCGTVSVYVPATLLTQGALTIGGIPFIIAAGTTLSSSVQVGANLCFDLTINLSGRITGAVVTANATSTVTICGTVTAYVEATSSTTGSLTIAGHAFTLALGSNLPASVSVGADLCLDLTLNALAQVQDGSATANVTTTVKICGTVTSYTEATLNSTGLLRIAGRTFTLALGSNLPASVSVGADLCLDLTLNALAQVQDGSATANVTSTIEVCGQITAYVAATSTNDGSITIAGVNRKIAAGADVDAGVAVGVYAKLRLTIDAFARVSDINVLKVGASLTAACNAPTPTPQPTPTPKPTPTPTPTPKPTPNGSPTPTPTPNGSPTPTPNGSPTPAPKLNGSPTPTPDATPTPNGPTHLSLPPDGGNGGGVADQTATCDPGSGTVEGVGGSDFTGGVLPDTDSLVRTGRVIFASAVPLGLLAALGLLAGWLVRRRQPDAELVPNFVDTTDDEQVQ